MDITFEVLLATMNQVDDSLIDKMNVHSDIIVCNQNMARFSFDEYEKNGYKVKWFDFCERGVGLNRNNALMRSTADICLLADDDVIYDYNYVNIITSAFRNNPSADVIVFNIKTDKVQRYEIKKKQKLNILTCGRFGAVRIAFRRTSVIKHGISFHLLFGGGAKFSAGEDTAFLIDCIQKGLNVIAVPDNILKLDKDSQSSWFGGYNKKFFFDTGFTYRHHYGKWAALLVIILLLKHRRDFFTDCSMKEAWIEVKKGMKEFNQY